jgi:signal transduction histidine kinase
LAHGVVEELQERGAKQRFLVDSPANLPSVEADPVRVVRILENLLENATKYSPEESEIKVSCRKKGNFVITVVSDQGQGISLHYRDKLFELFERVEVGMQSPHGLGLGLVVCKRLVEAQGGWITLESEEWKGSVFSFGLPIKRVKP